MFYAFCGVVNCDVSVDSAMLGWGGGAAAGVAASAATAAAAGHQRRGGICVLCFTGAAVAAAASICCIPQLEMMHIMKYVRLHRPLVFASRLFPILRKL